MSRHAGAMIGLLARSRLARYFVAALAGAAVDSLLFPTIAFGALMPQIVLAQFVAKVAGGAFWAWVLAKLSKGALTAPRH